MCPRIKVGSELTDSRNWNPECEEHGVDSEWWNSPEQQVMRDQLVERIRMLQAKAKEGRAKLRKEQS
jgi:hypothetical protein